MRKNKQFSIRISSQNLETIRRKAIQAHMTQSDYVTACCLGKRIVILNGLKEVLRQQKAIGNNLNQLTVLANMGKVQFAKLDSAVQTPYRNDPSIFTIVIPVAPGINERLNTRQRAENFANERLMENQNCCEDGKQLRVNADKKRQTARLICNICCSLVLKRSIIISRLIGITAELGCAQQTDKPKHANAAAK